MIHKAANVQVEQTPLDDLLSAACNYPCHKLENSKGKQTSRLPPKIVTISKVTYVRKQYKPFIIRKNIERKSIKAVI